jgi:hypothetical protein
MTFTTNTNFLTTAPPKTFALFHALSRYFTKFRALALIFSGISLAFGQHKPGLHFPS